MSDLHPLDRRAPPVARRRGEEGARASVRISRRRDRIQPLPATRDRATRAHLWTASSGWWGRIWTFAGTSEASNRRHPYSRGAEGDPSRPSLCRARSGHDAASPVRAADEPAKSKPTVETSWITSSRGGVDAGDSLPRGVGVGADGSMPRVDVRFGGTPRAGRARQAAATGDARARAVPGPSRREPPQERR